MTYDHLHQTALDKGTPYEFSSAAQLLGFLQRVSEIMNEIQSSMKKAMKVGIMPREQFQQRLLDIAAGRYKPEGDEPKVWFQFHEIPE
ncbi:MAG: hypothetical protein R3E89_11915 [Thiolinea sp.]